MLTSNSITGSFHVPVDWGTAMTMRRLRLRHPLAREIAVVLALKVVALATLYFLFFGPSQRPDLTPEAVGDAVFGPVSAAETRSDYDV